jgi:mycothiol synthase
VNPPAPFTARPAAPADAPAAAALISAFDRSYVDDPDETGEAEVADWWGRIDCERDTLLVEDAAGTLAAVGTLDARQADALDLDAYVHPDQRGRGLGGFLIDWAEKEVAARGRPILRASALTADTAAARLIASRGFAPVRHFYRMLIELDGPPPAPELPAGFALVPFRPGQDEEVLHATLEEAFADHWGYEYESLDEWQKSVFGRSWWDPSLVYLVREGDEVVAAEINAFRFGYGWIGSIGTRRQWRGRGLGRALLLAAFGEFHRRGECRIGLAVDAGNETGATQLYEGVGMRIAWQADVYEKRV